MVNPAFIPRNHRVEEVIEAAVVAADFTPFEALLLILAKPFEDQPAFAHYMDPPRVHERPDLLRHLIVRLPKR